MISPVKEDPCRNGHPHSTYSGNGYDHDKENHKYLGMPSGVFLALIMNQIDGPQIEKAE
jgi:hypothetical protein